MRVIMYLGIHFDVCLLSITIVTSYENIIYLINNNNMCNYTDIVFVCNFISVSSLISSIIIEYIGHIKIYIASRGFYYMDILSIIT